MAVETINKFHVLLAHHEHPEWSPPQIARQLNCDNDFVRRALASAGKKAPRGKRGPDSYKRTRRKASQEHRA